MRSSMYVQKMTVVALLIAIGVVIPMFSPVKLVLEPASFTLASHVPIFIAMFISPMAALAVVIGTTAGFFIGGFSPVIVARAASHVLFALLGAWYLRYKPNVLSSFFKTQIFSFIIGIIHAWAEVTVVSFFYLNGNRFGAYYSTATGILLLVGLGTIIHSMLDFVIAIEILKPLAAHKAFGSIFVTSRISK